jgi:hypothetical protein
MSTCMRMWSVVLIVVLGLVILMGWGSSAEAVLTIKVAEVQNGVAVVQGSKAPANASITWEGLQVTQANKGGNFAFQGPVPADCVGTLGDGVPTDTIEVALANCPPVSSIPAPVPQTGQTQCWDAAGMEIPCAGTGQDGDIQAGVSAPSPRFTDKGNGTVRDNLTGLIWLKQAVCFPGDGNGFNWEGALQAANTLASGSCGLTDGSALGDWRLPNRNELQSLLDFGFIGPAISNAVGDAKCTATDCAFSNIQSLSYWVSTTILPSIGVPDHGARAWIISTNDGQMTIIPKVQASHVWPVRGPE